jgi:6-phosphogluconolactonase (cycloisomerase 2 family)
VPGSPFAAPLGPTSVTFSPSGALLATANFYASNVSVFSVDPSTGTLNPVVGPPLATGLNPSSVAFSPNGGLLATANKASSNVSVFSVDATTGALSPVAGSPFAAPLGPTSVAFSPSGSLLATANFYASNLSVFSVDANSGALRALNGSPVPVRSASAAAFSPRADLLAVTSSYPGWVSMFATAPVITSARESARRWRERGNVGRKRDRKSPVGTIFSFTLNEPARVALAFTEKAGGRKVNQRCVAPTRRNRRHPRCTRTLAVGTLTFAAHRGHNALRFGGRISPNKKLQPGRYQLVMTATDAADQRSTDESLNFTIVA